jgi:hypothetical protein
MGTNSYDVAGRIDMTFPPEVTVLGWVIDFVGPDGPINRAWDSTFSPVPGGLLIPETTNTHFEAMDWAVAGVGFAQTYMFIAAAADEARLLISYDPDLLVDELTFDAVMTSNLQGLYMCEDNLGTSGAFTITLADADLDLIDDDGDGVAECDGDCDDTDAANFPGNTEVCDGADNDCDGALSDAEVDDDGDGQTECDGDCDDTDAGNFLGNPEVCDGADNDCDGVIPADETDDDGDGFNECADLDCDDADAANFPGNIEVCDGADNDCDGLADEELVEECEGVCGTGRRTCELGQWGACDVRAPAVEEFCGNGVDDDCDGRVDFGCICEDGDVQPCGIGRAVCIQGVQSCLAGQWGDCDGLVVHGEACPEGGTVCDFGECKEPEPDPEPGDDSDDDPEPGPAPDPGTGPRPQADPNNVGPTGGGGPEGLTDEADPLDGFTARGTGAIPATACSSSSSEFVWTALLRR